MWEYRVDTRTETPAFYHGGAQEAGYLAGRGQAGWELVAVVSFPLSTHLAYYWKRPLVRGD